MSSQFSADQIYLLKVITSYRNYRQDSLALIDEKLRQWERSGAGKRQPSLDRVYTQKLDRIRECIEQNATFISHIVPNAMQPQSHDPFNVSGTPDPAIVSHHSGQDNMEKVRSTLRQFVRDWSADGMAEREKTYGLICRTIEKLLNGHQPKSEYQVLVTGAGLGRLAFDIAKLGYSCQGNEFSFHMLLASNMILNRVDDQTCYTIYPWAHAFSNQISADKQALGVTVPDCQINGVIPEGTDFSMIAGEFLEAYADQSSEWDCVVSCFFIDTAHNILDYLESIYRLLRPGGYWINLGPLLYHFESIPGEASIELTLEEILMAAELVGFQKSTDIPSTFIDSTYAGNDSSMLTYHYNCAFFVMRKPQ